MEDDWSAPILKNDCLFSSAATGDDATQFASLSDGLSLETSSTYLDLCGGGRLAGGGGDVKTELVDDTSDYHGSSSGSPSSSLSSPMELKELGVDFSSPLCVNPFGANHGGGGPHSFMHSPASSSGSPFGMSFPASSGASPLPPVSHFSQSMLLHQQRAHAGQMMHGTPVDGFPQFQFDDVASTSPSPSDAGSPSDAFDSSYQQQLAAQQAAARTRSKMHEMAVRQRLITDQDPRAQGQVQLSLEEKRTLVQEGYAVPTRLPLTKAEEEALKIVRRKIKNKLSAQESRRKRKEYMDTLEARVQGYFSENAQLKARVKQLEAANRQLTAQMQKMQDM